MKCAALMKHGLSDIYLVLLCLSSEHYDTAEHIRDYDEYVGIMKEELL